MGIIWLGLRVSCKVFISMASWLSGNFVLIYVPACVWYSAKKNVIPDVLHVSSFSLSKAQ